MLQTHIKEVKIKINEAEAQSTFKVCCKEFCFAIENINLFMLNK